MHRITFSLRHIKSVSGPLAVVLSEVRNRRGIYKKGRLYLCACMYTVTRVHTHTARLYRITYAIRSDGNDTPTAIDKGFKNKTISMTYRHQRGNTSIAYHTRAEHYLTYISWRTRNASNVLNSRCRANFFSPLRDTYFDEISSECGGTNTPRVHSRTSSAVINAIIFFMVPRSSAPRLKYTNIKFC